MNSESIGDVADSEQTTDAALTALPDFTLLDRVPENAHKCTCPFVKLYRFGCPKMRSEGECYAP